MCHETASSFSYFKTCRYPHDVMLCHLNTYLHKSKTAYLYQRTEKAGHNLELSTRDICLTKGGRVLLHYPWRQCLSEDIYNQMSLCSRYEHFLEAHFVRMRVFYWIVSIVSYEFETIIFINRVQYFVQSLPLKVGKNK